MKIYKFVSYTSLAIIALAILILGSLPFRFPNSLIYWKPAILFLSPAIVLVALLFAKLLLSRKVFLSIIGLLAGSATLLTIAGLMSPIILAILLMAFLALYLSTNASQINFRRE